MNPSKFYKCLADETRLKTLLLIFEVDEACVCHLMDALMLDQPKTSRHLAELRKCEILQSDRRGKWIYYKLHPDLPEWARDVINVTAKNNSEYFNQALQALTASISDGC